MKFTKFNLTALAQRLKASPAGISICSFAALYLAASYYLRLTSYRDPGSWFFNPRVAYEPRYSTVRLQQAEAYVQAAESAPSFHRANDAGDPPRLCVGIPSIARKGVRYLRTTVGSLLDGLTTDERNGIHLIVFIPHSNPDAHPAYRESWLANLADDVLLYNISQAQIDHIVSMELQKELFREKGLYDYTYLLKACRATGAPYIAMLEDDVLAMDGWYHRTLRGIKKAEQQSLGVTRSSKFLYLRLFYTEELLGWNGEDWMSHLFWCIFVVAASGVALYWARSCSPYMKRVLTPMMIWIICGVPVPLAIILVFAAGRVTVFPLPTGVNAMSNYGCCSQGLVFPESKALDLIGWYEQAHIGFVDMLTEQYADEHGELRWALTPSVIQHIGRKSSKGDDFGPGSKHGLSVAEKLWNFRFELYDAAELRAEHNEIAYQV